MANRPIDPPPEQMIQELPTPDHSYSFFVEMVNRDSPRFQQLNPIKRGTPYSDGFGAKKEIIAAFPDLVFCKETVPFGSNTLATMQQHDWVKWHWASPRDSDSTFNSEISYLGDAVGNPVFARVYTVRRDEYESSPNIATGLPLTALIGVEMLSGGIGYTEANASFLGNGTDAEVDFIISDGSVIGAIVTKEGSGFDVNSVIEIIGDGTGATCRALIQPVAAILTSQKKMELDDGDPLSNEFVRVLRAYEVLPGPWIPFTRYDDDLGPVQGRRRAVLNTGQLGGQITGSSKTNYEGREGSSIVSIELQENWTTGAGTPGNPLFPILYWSTFSDERGKVEHTSQIQQSGGFPPTPGANIVHGLANPLLATKTWFEPYADNVYLVKKLTEQWTEFTPNDKRVISEFGGGVADFTETTTEPGGFVVDGGLMVVEAGTFTRNPRQQTLKQVKVPLGSWPILQGAHTDEKTGIVLNFTKQVIDAYSPVPPRSGYRGPFVEDQPHDKWKTIRIITAPDCSSLPGPESWIGTHPFSLPPTLLSVEAIWSDTISKFAEARVASDPRNPNTVSAQVSSGSSGGVIVTYKNGFRGHARATISRFYKCGGPFLANEIPSIFKILPSSGSVVLIETNSRTFADASDDDTNTTVNTSNFVSSLDGGKIGDEFQKQVHSHDISEMLVGDFTILNPTHRSQSAQSVATSSGGKTRQINAAGTDAFMHVRVPMSSPTPEQLRSQPNNQILADIQFEEWGYGIWIMYLFYVDMTGLL